MKETMTQFQELEVPSDWNQVYVGDIAKVKGGKRLPYGFYVVDTPTPYPYLRVLDMYPGGVNQSDIKYVPEQAFPAIQNYRIYSEDIFISVAGSLGIVGVVPPELSGANLTENANYITDIQCDRDYLKYWLMSHPIQNVIKLIQTTGAQPKLALGRIAKFVVAIPQDIEEQRAIAEVLSDVDGLINALDALITKKRAIKQATMQQLLTGRTRLPGFSGEWETKRIGNLFDAKAGGDIVLARSSDVQDNRYKYPIYANGLEQEGLYGFSNYAEEPPDSITVTARGTLGKAFYRKEPFIAIGRLIVLKPKISLDARFFCEYINYGIHFAVESTGVPQLTAPQIANYSLPVPTENEQRAIAAVLSDMNAEIAALAQRRDKTIAIKQGMMQQLLTGKVRLLK